MYRIVFYPSSALTDTSRASASFASKGKSSAGTSQQKTKTKVATMMKKVVMCGDHGLQRLAGNALPSLQSATAFRKRLTLLSPAVGTLLRQAPTLRELGFSIFDRAPSRVLRRQIPSA